MIGVKFCNLKLRNPAVLASGILGTTVPILKRVYENGAAAVTIKSIGPEKREGHPNPKLLVLENSIVNCVGLPSAGYKNMKKKFLELQKLKFPVIWSIYGSSITDYVNITKEILKYKPDMIELNISCPNKEDGLVFGADKNLTRKLISSVKKVSKKVPIMPKLTPNVLDIADIAKACEKAGADAISAINTVTGMLINVETGKPVLSYKTGGLSGPLIKPIALRCVYDIYEEVKIPILGMGGICNGRDALEMIMAGANAVGVGSAIYYRGIGVFNKIVNEMKALMKKNNYKSIKEIIGRAHE